MITVFLTLMVVGLTGLIMMAIPGLNRHGHGIGHAGHGGIHLGHGHGAGHATGHIAGGHTPAQATHGGAQAHTGSQGKESGQGLSPVGAARLIPSPRILFSWLALYGAFGYSLSTYMIPQWAALAAVLPALLIERFALTPLWNMLFQFQGKPSSPLEEMVMDEAEAVTPFRNGKGIVTVVRDGRTVQLSARLPESQATIPIKVGDKLRIEEVDAANERVIVTLH